MHTQSYASYSKEKFIRKNLFLIFLFKLYSKITHSKSYISSFQIYNLKKNAITLRSKIVSKNKKINTTEDLKKIFSYVPAHKQNKFFAQVFQHHLAAHRLDNHRDVDNFIKIYQP